MRRNARWLLRPTVEISQHFPHRRRYRRPQRIFHIQPHTAGLRGTHRFARELYLQRRDVQFEVREGMGKS